MYLLGLRNFVRPRACGILEKVPAKVSENRWELKVDRLKKKIASQSNRKGITIVRWAERNITCHHGPPSLLRTYWAIHVGMNKSIVSSTFLGHRVFLL